MAMIVNNDEQGDKLSGINNYIVEPRVWVGKDLNLNSSTDLTPYVGFGYRFYYEELKNKIVDDAIVDGYLLEAKSNNVQTQYFYVPLGATLSLHSDSGWRVEMNAEYDILAWGRISYFAPKITYDSINIDSPAYTNAFRQGYGIRGSLKLVKEGNLFDYFVEPYIRYWSIRSSNTVNETASFEGTTILKCRNRKIRIVLLKSVFVSAWNFNQINLTNNQYYVKLNYLIKILSRSVQISI